MTKIKPEHLVVCPHCGAERDITDKEVVHDGENVIECSCGEELYVYCTVTFRVDGVE